MLILSFYLRILFFFNIHYKAYNIHYTKQFYDYTLQFYRNVLTYNLNFKIKYLNLAKSLVFITLDEKIYSQKLLAITQSYHTK